MDDRQMMLAAAHTSAFGTEFQQSITWQVSLRLKATQTSSSDLGNMCNNVPQPSKGPKTVLALNR